jgi:hypothetical protein
MIPEPRRPLPRAEIILDRFELFPGLQPVIEAGCHVRLGKRQALLATLRNSRIEEAFALRFSRSPAQATENRVLCGSDF